MVVTCPILRQFILKMYEITVSYLDSAHFTMSHSGCYKTTYFFFPGFLREKKSILYTNRFLFLTLILTYLIPMLKT